MVDRRDLGSWLEGPGTGDDPAAGYPGQRLGRPQRGSGAIAGTGRRLASLMIDWLLCLLIVRGFAGSDAFRSGGSLWPVAILVLENVLLIGTAAATLGQRIVGLQVQRLDGARPGPGATVLRALLLGAGVPALTFLWQRDRRGLHELASGLLVVRR